MKTLASLKLILKKIKLSLNCRLCSKLTPIKVSNDAKYTKNFTFTKNFNFFGMIFSCIADQSVSEVFYLVRKQTDVDVTEMKTDVTLRTMSQLFYHTLNRRGNWVRKSVVQHSFYCWDFIIKISNKK